jgi:hypothetical protein
MVIVQVLFLVLVVQEVEVQVEKEDGLVQPPN